MTSLHILMIVPGFPRDEEDSTCIPAMQTFIRHLAEFSRHQITVVTLSYPTYAHQYTWYDLKVHAVHSSRTWPFNKIQCGQRASNIAKSIHRKRPIHIIHSFWLSDTALIGALISRQLQVPHLTTLMGQDVKKSNRYRDLSPLLSLRLVALTKYQVSFLPERIRNSIQSVIGWGVDQIEVSKFPRPIDILGVGSLTQNKDFKTFIEIIAQLRCEFPQIRVVIIGEGQQKSSLLDLIERQRLKDHVEMSGHLPRAEVLRLMSQSRILLHTAKFEGYGYVFSEALAAGCHIVSRRVGLAADLLHERLSVADTKSDLAGLLELKLREPMSHTPILVEHIRQTVDSYCQLYRSLSVSGTVADESLS